MSSQCVAAVRIYNDAYHQVHGRLPEIHINRGWIRIDGVNKSLRPNEVVQMAGRLRERARMERPEEHQHRMFIENLRESIRRNIDNENSVWDVRDELSARVQAQIKQETERLVAYNNESGIKTTGWREHIRKDTMILFFNRLFEKSGNSAFAMQRMMENFISFGRFDDENDCHECDLRGELESMYEKIHEFEHTIDIYKSDISNRNHKIALMENVIRDIKKEKEELKKNSVIFSMDEF